MRKKPGHRALKRTAAAILAAALLFSGCSASGNQTPDMRKTEALAVVGASAPGAGMLESKHITEVEFYESLHNARSYEIEGSLVAGAVPHHVTGADLISGFFALAANHGAPYDTVIVIAPNHEGDIADVILSEKDWNIGEGLYYNSIVTKKIEALEIPGMSITENSKRMEEDHSASVLMPYVSHYLTGAQVVPILVSRSLSLESTVNFARGLFDIIEAECENPLIVCSMDFSHYLTPLEAAENDGITENAIMENDIHTIHSLPNEFIDSPASLILFLSYLDRLELSPRILDHTDASAFVGASLQETTTYFVLAGVLQAE